MRKRYLPAIGLILLFAQIGCATPGAITATSDDRETFKFIVADSESVPIEGADVFVLSSEVVPAGRTNGLGVVKVSRSTLKKDNPHTVLFCAERFFCGAIRIDQEFFEYSEMYIELAPFAVR